MTGVAWFPFYPRDWFGGTMTLSDRARGAYIDLLARMYDLGRPLDYDEKELCRFLRYRDRRQLRPVLDELIAAGKIKVVNNTLTNDRFEREMAKAAQAVADGRKGGRPRGNPQRERHQRASRGRSHDSSFLPDQRHNQNLPQPDTLLRKGAEAPRTASPGNSKNLGEVIFGTCLSYLVGSGIKDRNARTILGRWRKDHGDAAVVDVVLAASREAVSDPVAWCTKAFAARARSPAPTAYVYQGF